MWKARFWLRLNIVICAAFAFWFYQKDRFEQIQTEAQRKKAETLLAQARAELTNIEDFKNRSKVRRPRRSNRSQRKGRTQQQLSIDQVKHMERQAKAQHYLKASLRYDREGVVDFNKLSKTAILEHLRLAPNILQYQQPLTMARVMEFQRPFTPDDFRGLVLKKSPRSPSSLSGIRFEISSLDTENPFFVAGLREGDVILACNGVAMSNSNNLFGCFKKLTAKETVHINYYRASELSQNLIFRF